VPFDSVATAYKSLPIALLWTANCTVLKSAWRLTTLDQCAGIVAISHVRPARQSRSNPIYDPDSQEISRFRGLPDRTVKRSRFWATDYDRIGSFSPVFRCQFGEKYDAKKVRNTESTSYDTSAVLDRDAEPAACFTTAVRAAHTIIRPDHGPP